MAYIANFKETSKSKQSTPAQLERFHHAEDHAFFNESHYYNGASTPETGRNRLVTRISRRSNKGEKCLMFIELDLEEEGIYTLELDNLDTDFSVDHPQAKGLSYVCEEPMKRWRVVYKGPMMKGKFVSLVLSLLSSSQFVLSLTLY